ncbi:hypothetical protein MMC26_005385 [Xylographa opegraphella]|nr:hypothetical protein [Xylographa opegraphella]
MILRPILHPDKKRLTWSCNCGHTSFNDFIELQPGAVSKPIRSRLSLKTVVGIRFVQFELRKSEHVNICKEHDLPPAEREAEYSYRPMPAELIPPLGENYMMHLYRHPDHADAIAATDLAQMLKKLADRLCVCPVEGRGVGWGVLFVEGWHYNVVCLLAFALILLASLVFLGCWAVLQHDVQGASGIAAYMLTLATLALGCVQAAFELELW